MFPQKMMFMLGMSIILLQSLDLHASNETKKEEICLTLINEAEIKQKSPDLIARNFWQRKDDLLAWSKEYPENIAIQYSTGLLYLLNEDVEASLPYLRIACEKSNFHARIGSVYSLALKMSMRPNEALFVSKQLVIRNPNNPSMRLMYALGLKNVQRYQDAIDAFEIARQLMRSIKEGAVVTGYIGRCELFLGKHDEAIKHLVEANSLHQNDVRQMVPLAEAYIKTGEIDAAKAILEQVRLINSSYSRAIYWTAVIQEMEDQPNAEMIYSKALAAAKNDFVRDNGSDNYLLYQIHLKLGDNEKAQDYLYQARNLGHTFEAPWR